tara:strand:+ start:125 stop:487 length:363 start_codon:yes stop_codon:yes gene_type:complete
MALYDRYRGYDDDNREVDKLAIWGTITSFAEILNGELTDAQLIERFDLSPAEQAEFAKIKIKANNDISTMHTALISAGVNSNIAMGISRSTVRDQFTHILMRAEFDYDTRSEFNTAMGIT